MTAARVTWIGGRLFLSLLVLAVAAFLVYALGSFTPLPVQRLDSIAYWQAGQRVAAGGPLYPPVPDTTSVDAYRYAPWFALLWAPFTALQRDAVLAGWATLLAIASVAALIPLLRAGFAGWCLAALMVPFFADAVRSGNVQPLVVATLLYAVPHRRAGPLAIALTTSLKLTPLAFVLVYVGRGDWRALTVAVGGALVLWAPAPFLGLLDYPTTAAVTSLSMFSVSPLLWAGLLLGGAIVTLFLARGPYAWIAGASTALLAFPYPQWHYPSILVAGVARTGLTTVQAWDGQQDEPLAAVLGQRDRDADGHQPGSV
jgi:hypothetical protein